MVIKKKLMLKPRKQSQGRRGESAGRSFWTYDKIVTLQLLRPSPFQ